MRMKQKILLAFTGSFLAIAFFSSPGARPADTAPPIFDGVILSYPGNGCVGLEWNPAQDNSLPVWYKIYMSRVSGSYDWSAPAMETMQDRVSISGLENGMEYFFVVRPKDAVGNEDANLKEHAVTPGAVNPYPNLPYKEIIFPLQQDIPSHAPSVVEPPSGELFAAWYSPVNGSSNSAIWGSRRLVGAKGWSAPSIIHHTTGYSDKNPVLYLGQDKKLWLFWSLEKKLPKQHGKRSVWVKTSEDFGHSWAEAYSPGIPLGYLPKAHPIRLHNGWIVLPLYTDWSASSAVVTSKDNGLTWGRPRFILFFMGAQPSIIQRSDLSLFTLMRSGMWPRLSWQAVSKNFGRSWVGQQISRVKNPGSAFEMLKLHNGNVVLAFNNSRLNRDNLSLLPYLMTRVKPGLISEPLKMKLATIVAIPLSYKTGMGLSTWFILTIIERALRIS